METTLQLETTTQRLPATGKKKRARRGSSARGVLGPPSGLMRGKMEPLHGQGPAPERTIDDEVRWRPISCLPELAEKKTMAAAAETMGRKERG